MYDRSIVHLALTRMNPSTRIRFPITASSSPPARWRDAVIGNLGIENPLSENSTYLKSGQSMLLLNANAVNLTSSALNSTIQTPSQISTLHHIFTFGSHVYFLLLTTIALVSITIFELTRRGVSLKQPMLEVEPPNPMLNLLPCFNWPTLLTRGQKAEGSKS